MGNDFYHYPVHAVTKAALKNLSTAPTIGENCIIQRAIIDKNVCIGNNVRLINTQNLKTYDSDPIYVRDGIIVVPQGSVIPEGFTF
jgi:glucose-1-phosphate adenylyltransferase